jgi:hypothetical protein
MENQTCDIEVNGPFRVIISRLPSGIVVYPQQSTNNSGWIAFYPPIQYNAGTANFSVVFSDTTQAPFRAVPNDGSG